LIRLSGERAMPKPYSIDLRGRVVEEVESGASRREAAVRYGLSPSVVVIWVQRFEETGSIAAKPSGDSTSPLERHAEFLLGLIAARPDLTLDENVAAMRKRRIAGSRGAVWRFFNRRATSFKKKLCTRRSRSARTSFGQTFSILHSTDGKFVRPHDLPP
jgi:transposase